MLQADTDKNNEKLDVIPREIIRIRKAARSGRQKNQDYHEVCMRLNELKKLKTENENETEA